MVKYGHPTVVVNVTAEAHCAPGGCPSNLRANGAGRVGKQHPTDYPQRLRSWDLHSRKSRNLNVTSGIFLILYPRSIWDPGDLRSLPIFLFLEKSSSTEW